MSSLSIDKNKSLVNIAHVVYGLQVLGIFFLIPILVAGVLAYVKKGDAKGTWLESHFKWQIRTAWIYLIGIIIGAILTLIFIGIIVVIMSYVWLIYRIIKGWLALSENKALF